MATAIDVETPPDPHTPATPTAGVNRPLSSGNGIDGGTVAAGAGGSGSGGGGFVNSAISKWQLADSPQKSAVLLRSLTCLCSLISAIVMATNKHGDWKEFNNYEEYRYLVAIGFLAFLYTTIQLVRFVMARDFVGRRFAGIFDFAGDQIVAYLLMSALSAAIPMTNRMREGADNIFTDASSAAISMAFFAFVFIAISAIISGYKLSRQHYI